MFSSPQELWAQAVEIWLSGGWAMVAIAAVAVVMFGLGVHVWFRLRDTEFASVPESTWRRWIDAPEEREGAVGELLDLTADTGSFDDTVGAFADLRKSQTAPFERDLKVMRICVSAAPLVGLLGTVMGMLATFGALAAGSGGDKTMTMVADGISEALITTEAGLVIALSGLFFQYRLTRTYERYKAFLAHLESVTTQTLYRRRNATRGAA